MKYAKVFRLDGYAIGRIYNTDYIGDASVSIQKDGHYCSVCDISVEDVIKELKNDNVHRITIV